MTSGRYHLPRCLRLGKYHPHTRQLPELDGLPCQGKGPADHCLRSDDRRHGGQYHQRHDCPAGRQVEKRRLDSRRLMHQQRRLAQIVQHQRREYDQKPGTPNGRYAEMPEVGIQGLATRYHEKYRPRS